jgi:hypothetical protein
MLITNVVSCLAIRLSHILMTTYSLSILLPPDIYPPVLHIVCLPYLLSSYIIWSYSALVPLSESYRLLGTITSSALLYLNRLWALVAHIRHITAIFYSETYTFTCQVHSQCWLNKSMTSFMLLTTKTK